MSDERKLRIKELRDEKNYSQESLAGELNTNQSSLSELETGIQGKKLIALLVRLADLFEVSVDYLIGRTAIREALTDEDLQLAYRINHLRSTEISGDIKALLDDVEALMNKPKN